ncbi:NucA/NucB deoxyribonuclease domain-containing protein [Sivoneniella epilithica]
MTDPTGLFSGNIQEFTVTEKLRTDLEAAYRLPAALRTYQATRTSMLAIAAAVATATAFGAIMTVSTARSLNRLLGVPIVFWGNDVNEVTEHQFKAVTGSGYTINNTSGAIGQSIPISVALHRGDTRFPDKWRYDHPQSIGRSRVSQVDEFPYGSTIEGGENNYNMGLVSLHQVNGSQNASNGTRLRHFWNKPNVNVTKYGTNRLYSLFLNVPVPGLGGSFGLDRQGQPVSV